MARQRQRTAESRPTRIVSPAAKIRWNRTYKITRKGLTPEKFQVLLEAQGHACAMGREPFEDGQRIFIDHDHSCCPGDKSCGKCVRGLLCLTCNIAVGYIEAYFDLAMVYLNAIARPVPKAGRAF